MNNTKKESGVSESKKWNFTIRLTFLLGIFCAGYVSMLGISLSTLQGWSFILAAVSSLLLATALSASSISYYFGWPNLKLGYQKQIGVTAFYLAVLYCGTLLILYPETYWYGFSENIFTPDLLLGLIAMFLFFAMVLVNSKPIAPYLSWDTIKFVLGLGYISYALLVLRAVLIEGHVWVMWLQNLEAFPPGRLLLACVAMVVLLLRISIPIHRHFTKN